MQMTSGHQAGRDLFDTNLLPVDSNRSRALGM